MCGRIWDLLTTVEIANEWQAAADEEALTNGVERRNGGPSEELRIIRWHEKTQRRVLSLAQWGLIPSWTKDIATARKPINARAETIRTSAMFKGAFETRRCLVPISGFFEWRAVGKGKQPYAIAMKDNAPFCMAGLWENWKSTETGEWRRTFCVITTRANDYVGRIHDRMPVILSRADHARWLGEDPATPDELEALLVPFTQAPLAMWPIDPRMNRSSYDGDDILDPRGPIEPE